METKTIIEIDAAGRALGRVATEAASALRGKNSLAFMRHLDPKVAVTVVNAKQLKIAPQKLTDKNYRRYTGYPGGLKSASLEQVIAKKGYAEPLRRAIKGMLPANKLRAKMLNNLTIHE